MSTDAVRGLSLDLVSRRLRISTGLVLFAFAATTDAVPSETLDLVFTALIVEEQTWKRIEAANPAAAQAIRDRLADARRRGLWASRLNSVAAFFDDGRKEAAE